MNNTTKIKSSRNLPPKRIIFLFLFGTLLNFLIHIYALYLRQFITWYIPSDFDYSFMDATEHFWKLNWERIYWSGNSFVYTVGTVFIFTPFYFLTTISYNLGFYAYFIVLDICFMFVLVYILSKMEKKSYPFWLEILLVFGVSLILSKFYDHRVHNLKPMVAFFIVGFLWSSEKFQSCIVPCLFLALMVSFTLYLVPVVLFYLIKPFDLKKILYFCVIFIAFNFPFLLELNLITGYINYSLFFFEVGYDAFYLSQYNLLIYISYLTNVNLSLLGYILIFATFIVSLKYLDFREYTMIYPFILILFFVNFVIWRHYAVILPILYLYCVEYFSIERDTNWKYLPFICLFGLSFPIPLNYMALILPELLAPISSVLFIVAFCVYFVVYKRDLKNTTSQINEYKKKVK